MMHLNVTAVLYQQPVCSARANKSNGNTLVKQLQYRHGHARQQRRGACCAGQLRTASCAVLRSASLRCSAAHHRLQATKVRQSNRCETRRHSSVMT